MAPMGDFTEVERSNLASLDDLDLEYVLLSPTKTGLQKSIIDATWEHRDFLHRYGIHNYGKQQSGPEYKVAVPVSLIDAAGELFETKASLYRTASRGDARLWVSGLSEHCNGGDVIATVVSDGRIVMINVSRGFLAFETTTVAATNGGNMQHSTNYWGALRQLWSRSTGGSDVAARPSDSVNSFWPTAPRAAGVDAAAEWISSGLRGVGIPRMLFLVGGPGAGKSHTASQVVSQWQEIDPSNDGLAHRTYRYAVGPAGDRRLVVVNDATIQNVGEGFEASLMADVSAAVGSKDHFLACVNRGILVEEAQVLRSASDADGDSSGAAALRWLHESGGTLHEGSWHVLTSSETDYLKFGTLTEAGEIRAQVAVVYLDVCSMLEPSPSVQLDLAGGPGANITADPYRVINFLHRNEEPVLSPASELLAGVTRTIYGQLNGLHDHFELDPFAANILSISNEKACENLISIWRAGEIASSQRLTFREIWGAICRSIVGDLPSIVSGEQIQEFLAARQPNPAMDAKDIFHTIKDLAEYRYSQSLFGCTPGFDPVSNPVTRVMHVVDPTKDAKPGHMSGHWDSGWAAPISEAFTGYTPEVSPLSVLIERSADDDVFRSVVTPFDQKLDFAFATYMKLDRITDKDRQQAISWYGSYLTRLYAVAKGIPAFRSEIVTWTQAWTMAPVVPDQLQHRLTTLLRPARSPDGLAQSSLIPVFDSRTEPIRGHQYNKKLAVRLDAVEIKLHRESDMIMLDLFEHAQKVSSISLDFALIREALACNDGHPGVTELSETTSPRLERFRSARLVPRQLIRSDYRLVLGADDRAISLGDDN